MKIMTILSLLCLLLTSSVWAQTADEKEVAAGVEALRNAMVEGSQSALENVTAKELSYGHSGGKIENRAEFVEAIASGKNDFKVITLSEQTISIVNTIAIVRHKFTGEVINNGVAQTPNIGVMQIWSKQQGKWLLLARQAFKL